MKRIIINIPKLEYRKIKIHSAEHDVSLTSLFSTGFDELLGSLDSGEIPKDYRFKAREDLKPVLTRIPEDQHRQLKVYAAKHDVALSIVLSGGVKNVIKTVIGLRKRAAANRRATSGGGCAVPSRPR